MRLEGNVPALEVIPLSARRAATPTDTATVKVAFVVPLQGPTGIYGPSCLACGELAVEQLNAASGILGRHVELVVVDAGREPHVVADEVAMLVDLGAVDVVAGWHISAVRQAITARVGGRVTYVYAAMHEGHDNTPGVFMLGERPVNQLLPGVRWMRENLGIGRWAVVGNDYVFPRVTGATARQALQGSTSQIVSETYVPLGTSDFAPTLRSLGEEDVDGVVMLLMGQDAVHFNRQFARQGLDDAMVRLSPAVEENTLLGGGPDAHRHLYAAAAYFDSMATSESSDLSRAYHRRFGPWAPALNVIGESCYEAMIFLSRLAERCGGLDIASVSAVESGAFYEGPRGLLRLDGNLMNQDVYLARADRLEFCVEDQIATAH